DANGIMNVTAKDKATNKEQNIRIESSSGLTDQEIDNMTNEAEKHAEEDEKFRKKVEAHNQAEQTLFATQKALDDMGDKLEDADKKPVEDALAELETVKTSDNPEEITEKIEAVNQAMMKVSEKIYAQAQQAQQQAGGPDMGGAPGADPNAGADQAENVEDADYKVVDEEK
ncbi:MAG: Hsp70 family protein, partial [Candidatus Marinimicrobia bacterium]|nr:Hsp70 family protein [Candidatus Neomarinimicrobiota bacterium]